MACCVSKAVLCHTLSFGVSVLKELVTVFEVRSAIRRLGCLYKYVTVRIGGPKYVNVIHLL